MVHKTKKGLKNFLRAFGAWGAGALAGGAGALAGGAGAGILACVAIWWAAFVGILAPPFAIGLGAMVIVDSLRTTAPVRVAGHRLRSAATIACSLALFACIATLAATCFSIDMHRSVFASVHSLPAPTPLDATCTRRRDIRPSTKNSVKKSVNGGRMKIMVVMPDAHLTLYLSASCTIHGLQKILAKKVKRIYRRVPQFNCTKF